MSARNFTVQALLDPGAAAVTALVSTRVYPLPVPLKTTMPAIGISLAAENEEYTLSGSTQYPLAIVQVHCLGASSTSADTLGEAVKVYLRDLAFQFGSERGSFLKSGPDFLEYDDEQKIFRRLMTFDLRWR